MDNIYDYVIVICVDLVSEHYIWMGESDCSKNIALNEATCEGLYPSALFCLRTRRVHHVLIAKRAVVVIIFLARKDIYRKPNAIVHSAAVLHICCKTIHKVHVNEIKVVLVNVMA